MSFSREEVTPLVRGRRVAPDNGTRRRGVPQHTPAFEQSMYSLDDSAHKVDRRSCCSRLCSRTGRVVCSGPSKDARTEYYEDTFNDEPWSCTCGTGENDGVWTNYGDKVGSVMSSMVWVLYSYSIMTISLLAQNNNIPSHIAMIYTTICALALACHTKTMFTDPGSISQEAVPLASLFKKGVTTHAMCSHCQTYKPPSSHHCRICNRCISRMDHHCPWMNNCVGANNFKHFTLFLCYTWTTCAFALILFGSNYFFCNSDDCVFPDILILLVRVMTVLAVATLLFVSSMLLNVVYGLVTGIGTIDRLKKKANGTLAEAMDEPLALKDVFGIQGYWTWLLPVDPVFEDYDKVMGYSIPQRLMRERSCEI